MLRTSVSDAEFESYFVKQLEEMAPGSRIVLGSGDNFPTDSSFDRLKLATRLVAEYGRYPLCPSAVS